MYDHMCTCMTTCAHVDYRQQRCLGLITAAIHSGHPAGQPLGGPLSHASPICHRVACTAFTVQFVVRMVSLTGSMLGVRLNEEEIDRLKKGVSQYKYVSPALSFTEKLYLNDLWDAVASLYPQWLAPNLVTMMGACCITLGTALLLLYSPHLQGTAPSWVYVAQALLLFAYQTFDGSDGKQARRTRSGSALGHMCDHGVDAFVGSLISTWSVDVFGQGMGHWVFPLVVVGGQLGFFLSNLVAHHTGLQLFHAFDVQEVEATIMLALLLKAAGGAPLWEAEVGPPGLRHPVWLWTAGATAVGLTKNVGGYLWAVLRPGLTGTAAPGKGLPQALHHVAAVALHSALVFRNLWSVPALTHPLFLCAVVSFAGLTLSLLVLVGTGLPFPRAHWAVWVQLLPLGLGGAGAAGWGAAAAAVLCYGLYAAQVGRALKQQLGIQFFRISAPADSPSSSPVRAKGGRA